MRWQFQVQGSAPEPYVVTFEASEGQLKAFCTCQAGEKGMHCKHRMSILAGDASGVLGGDADACVPAVVAALTGTPLAARLAGVAEAEAALAEAKAKLSAAKKAVDAAMRGQG